MKGLALLPSILVGLIITGGLLAGLYATGMWNKIQTQISLFISLLQVSILVPELRPVGLLLFGPMIIGLIYIIARLVRGGG